MRGWLRKARETVIEVTPTARAMSSRVTRRAPDVTGGGVDGSGLGGMRGEADQSAATPTRNRVVARVPTNTNDRMGGAPKGLLYSGRRDGT